MDIVELVEIALANSNEQRVEVAALEPADIRMEAVSGLAQVLSELVENAIAFSEPEDKVRVTGLHEQGDYLLSVSDRGVGLPAPLMAELNRVLQDPNATGGPEPRLGISLVARLASRHDIGVELVPGAPGTTARVTVPARLVGERDPERPAREPTEVGYRLPPRSYQAAADRVTRDGGEQMVDLTRFERGFQTGSGVIAMTEEAKREAEAFLEKVFAPLVQSPGVTERPAPRPPNGNGPGAAVAPEPVRPEPERREQGGTVTSLRTRVPGENFSLVEDDASTIAAERAIDIRTALSKYAEGRRSAHDAEDV